MSEECTVFWGAPERVRGKDSHGVPYAFAVSVLHECEGKHDKDGHLCRCGARLDKSEE